MEEFSVAELQAIRGGLIAERTLIQRANMRSSGMKARLSATETALEKVKQELEIRKILKAG